ncbi:GNAT family N-acetyltransferase [Streptobacillus felis]|uniref:GNAT family N-acetyltransferase n=1 Tax=Streptobacillus felis TaxID=1384509 RepID=A0A7Z0PET8_9FUSO|nr:GNAT family N-acetyltransferase [Streptobacillus felis]NYV27719.1 GNAT family N-acetyltransferase [Streptobacillus felis]
MKNNEIEEILNLHNECFLDKKKYIDIENMFNNSSYKINTIVEEEFIGYMILLDSFDSYELFEIAIKEKYRNKGYAKKLLYSISYNKDIFLEVSEKNIAAIKLYEEIGFKKISIRKKYYLDGSNALIMKK